VTSRNENRHRPGYGRERYRVDVRASLWRLAKQRARKRGLDFTISIDDIVIPAVCPILLITLANVEGKCTSNSPSIDRLDNAKGYTKENIRVISWLANTRKSNLSRDDIERLWRYVSQTP